jgi:hypothetical protein
MKRLLASLIILVALLGSNLPALGQTTQPSVQPEVRGLAFGAAVTDLLGSTGVAGGVRYWHQYAGADFSLGFEKGSVDYSGTDVFDGTGFGLGFAGLLGFPIGRVKPHLRLGFAYGYSKDSVSDVTLETFEIAPSIGVDFLAADHLLFGMDILAFPFVLWGDVEGYDVGGFDISFLNSVRIAYVF